MKKHVLVAAALFGIVFAANAQTESFTDEKNRQVTPESGDIGLGFDAVPMFDYFGNFFNGTSGNSVSAGWATTDLSIMGKYFTDESTALRGQVRIGFGGTNAEMLTDTSTSGTPAYITDESKTSYNAITLGGGIEMRRGKGRIQGYYGGEALIGLSGSSTSMTYEVALSDNWNNGGLGRTLTTKSGSTFGLTLRGFIGVEFFVLPKVSIGAEYGWGFGLWSTGQGETTTEAWDLINSSLISTTSNTGGSSSFALDTDNSGGALRMMFHF